MKQLKKQLKRLTDKSEKDKATKHIKKLAKQKHEKWLTSMNMALPPKSKKKKKRKRIEKKPSEIEGVD